MTVPGAGGSSHQDERPEQIHRYRHDKRAAEASTNSAGDPQKFAGLYTGPYFDPAMPTNISVQLGDTALLICKVNQVGRKTVSCTISIFQTCSRFEIHNTIYHFFPLSRCLGFANATRIS